MTRSRRFLCRFAAAFLIGALAWGSSTVAAQQPQNGAESQCDIVTKQPPPPPQPALLTLNLYHVGPPPQPPPGVIDVCAAEALRSQGCGHDAARNPFAETLPMRQGITVSLDPDVRRRFAATALGQDMGVGNQLLGEYLASPDSDVRWAAALALAYLAVRTEGAASPSALTALQRLGAAVTEGPELRASDYWYLLAVRQVALGDSLAAWAALQKAVSLEPSFFAAQALKLRILLQRGAPKGRSSLHCIDYFRKLFGVGAAVAAINPCPLTVAHLSRYLSAELGPLASAGPAERWAMRYYLSWVAKNDPAARHAYQAARQAIDRDLQPSCRAMVLADLRALQAALEP